MPIKCPSGRKARYRYRKGTKMRLAYCDGVVEAKNMRTGKTHTQREFARDRARGSKR